MALKYALPAERSYDVVGLGLNAVAALKCRDLGGRSALPTFSEALAFMVQGARRGTESNLGL